MVLFCEVAVIFKVNSARFTAPEGFFKPKRWGLDTKALHEHIYEAVQSSPIDSRKILLRYDYDFIFFHFKKFQSKVHN